MWIFAKTGIELYDVGYLTTANMNKKSTLSQRFDAIYQDLSLREAERKVHYLNGGRKEFTI